MKQCLVQVSLLSTHSLIEEGYHFGSITPYIVVLEGDLAIFISHLAEHTQNIERDAKVSLTIFVPMNDDNPSANTRISCLENTKIEHRDILLREQYPATLS